MDKTKDMAIREKLCREKDQIAERLMNGSEMSIQDLDRLDKIYHTLKSQCQYMEHAEKEEYGTEYGMSGARGRGPDGRYISRAGGPAYSEGYARGYSEAMNHNPDYPPVRNGW
jgi:hypothetical protein